MSSFLTSVLFVGLGIALCTALAAACAWNGRQVAARAFGRGQQGRFHPAREAVGGLALLLPLLAFCALILGREARLGADSAPFAAALIAAGGFWTLEFLAGVARLDGSARWLRTAGGMGVAIAAALVLRIWLIDGPGTNEGDIGYGDLASRQLPIHAVALPYLAAAVISLLASLASRFRASARRPTLALPAALAATLLSYWTGGDAVGLLSVTTLGTALAAALLEWRRVPVLGAPVSAALGAALGVCYSLLLPGWGLALLAALLVVAAAWSSRRFPRQPVVGSAAPAGSR